MSTVGVLQVEVTADTRRMVTEIQGAATAAGAKAGKTLSRSVTDGGLWKDAGGKWRNQLGQFATAAEIEAAGLGDRMGAKAGSTFQKSFSQALGGLGTGFSNIGKALSVAVTLPVLGVGYAATRAAISWEDAFAGVRKTIDATDAEFATLAQGIRDMAKEVPASAEEIAAVAEAAGQLGIEKSAILDFSRTMIDLGEATNLSSQEAADALARLANITQMPQDQFDNLGSTVVALGNNLAATESEIVAMAMRLAGAGSQIGLTEAQITAFAGALSSVGIEAEAGGTAFSRVMIELQNATMDGGAALDTFAKTAGVSAQQFAASFKKDPSAAIISFIEGLNRVKESGGNVNKVLDELGLSDIRVSDALRRASGSVGLFKDALVTADTAWSENTALSDEATKRYATMASQLRIVKNRFRDFAITIGEALIPTITDLLKKGEPLLQWIEGMAKAFAQLPQGQRETIAGFAALAAAVGPVLFVIGKIATGIAAIAGSAGLGAIAGPVAAVVAVIAVLAAAFYAAWTMSEDFRNGVINAFNTVKDAVMAAVDYIKSKLQENADAIAVVRDAFKAVADFVGNYILPALAAYYSTIIGFLSRIVGFVIDYAAALVRAFQTVAPAFLTVLASVAEALGDFITIIASFAIAFLEGIDAAFGWIPEVGGWMDSAKAGVMDFAQGAAQFMDEAAVGTRGAATAIQRWGTGTEEAGNKAASGLNNAARAMKNVNDAASDLAALSDYKQAVENVTKAFKKNIPYLTLNNQQGRDLAGTLTTLATATQTQIDKTQSASQKYRYASDSLGVLQKSLKGTKMDPQTQAALIAPFQALIDQLADAGIDVSQLQTQLDKLKSKTIEVTVKTTQVGGRPPGVSAEEWYGTGKAATGGLITGPGTATSDSVPMMLSNGEFVIRAAAVSKFGEGFFASLNKGALPRARWAAPAVSGGNAGGVTYNTYITNPAPERASESLPAALRRASFTAGWSS